MALLAQRHRDWGCLLVLPPQTSKVASRSITGVSGSPAPKIQTSVDSSQPETASWQSCCSASPAHGTARTEAQRLGLLACLACSRFKRSFRGPCRAHPAAMLPKYERLQIAHFQNELEWKAVAQPHLSMALLAQRHRDWGCLLVLPPQTSNVALAVRAKRLRQPCSQNANVCRYLAARKRYPAKLLLSLICPLHCLHRGTETEFAYFSCHLKLQTYLLGVRAARLRQPCSQNANVCR